MQKFGENHHQIVLVKEFALFQLFTGGLNIDHQHISMGPYFSSSYRKLAVKNNKSKKKQNKRKRETETLGPHLASLATSSKVNDA